MEFSKYFNKEGKILFASIAYEVSKRKRADDITGREWDKISSALWGNTPMAYWFTMPKQRISSMHNPAMCRMLGYTENELKAMSLGDIPPQKRTFRRSVRVWKIIQWRWHNYTGHFVSEERWQHFLRRHPSNPNHIWRQALSYGSFPWHNRAETVRRID